MVGTTSLASCLMSSMTRPPALTPGVPGGSRRCPFISMSLTKGSSALTTLRAEPGRDRTCSPTFRVAVWLSITVKAGEDTISTSVTLSNSVIASFALERPSEYVSAMLPALPCPVTERPLLPNPLPRPPTCPSPAP